MTVMEILLVKALVPPKLQIPKFGGYEMNDEKD